MPRIITFVASLSALAILAGIIGVYAVLKGDSLGVANRRDDHRVSATLVPSTPSRAMNPIPDRPGDDLVERARKTKPLEDISRGDRVLYQGHVCTWLSWDRNINTSSIRCPAAVAFTTETGRLTPVELKGTPTKD